MTIKLKPISLQHFPGLGYHICIMKKPNLPPIVSHFTTPQEAETAFYEALQSARLDLMMSVWANDETIVCIHPMGPRLQGIEKVRAGWQQIFQGGSNMRIEISDGRFIQDSLLSVHMVHENILIRNQQRMIATNIYQLTSDGWRMILHHASISDEGMMEQPDEHHPHILH